MESGSKSALESEILAKALEKPLFSSFDPSKIQSYLTLLLSMKT